MQVPLWVGLICFGFEAAETPKYHTHAELSTRINELVAEYPQSCSAESLGTSVEGRAIWTLRLALGGAVEPDRRSALLIVATIDGDHLVGGEVAFELAAGLLGAAREGDPAAVAFLTDHTLYVVPRVNPDAAERFFGEVRDDRRRNLRPDDQDRDGLDDEDPPNDLNGDGLITMMRVYDPDEADRMPDPRDPRLDVEPDRDKGERSVFALYVEGIDDDGDGEFNEDPLGGVDLNMNYMHGYREHADGAGPHQVSEPESLSLLEYVLAHQNIAVVLVYGRHDNLSKPPDGKGTYPSGAPKNIDAKDVGLYQHISKRFGEITELKDPPREASEGAFFAWAYAQFGVPAFATPLWTRPEPRKKEKEEEEEEEAAEPGQEREGAEGEGEEEGGTPSGIGDIAQETIDELRAEAESRGFEITEELVAELTPARVEGFTRRMGIKVRRVEGKSDQAGVAKSKEEVAWLKYSDEQRNGSGFVEWQPFDHPQLGRVEIGGWVPYFKTNPPPEAIPELARKQMEFALDLAGRFPQVGTDPPQITRLAGGLYEVKFAVVNEGYLPTGTAMAVRNRRARPYVVRLSVPNEQVVAGKRVNKVWSIPGSGGRESFRWIIHAPDGAEVKITLFSEKLGELERTIWLQEQGGGDS